VLVGCAKVVVELAVILLLRVVDPPPPTNIVTEFVEEDAEPVLFASPKLLDIPDIVPMPDEEGTVIVERTET
jgi:hypothetical protein